MTIAFGPWSTGLGLAVAFAWLVAARLAGATRNRAANRWLAALLALLAMRVVVYVIGYAGFYDAYPWLSFAPFDLALCFGPLLWFHVPFRGSFALLFGVAPLFLIGNLALPLRGPHAERHRLLGFVCGFPPRGRLLRSRPVGGWVALAVFGR